MDSCLKAGIHNMQVLIGKREIENNVRLEFIYESGQFRHIVGIHLCYLDVPAISPFNIASDGLTLGEGPACNQYFREDFRNLRAFVRRNGGHAPCPDYHYSSTVLFSIHKSSPGQHIACAIFYTI